MTFSTRVNKYYESRQIYESLKEDNPAVYLLFGLCNYTAGNDTLHQGHIIHEDLKKGILHEIPDYNVKEVTNHENYVRTGKMKYDMSELAKDDETIGELLHRLFKPVWDITTKDLYDVIDDNTLALEDLILNINTTMRHADASIFEENFLKLMKRYDWTETEQNYQEDKDEHCVTLDWLQEKQEQELKEVLQMDIMHYADNPSTQYLEEVDFPYHRGFLSCDFKADDDYKKAYAKFMKCAVRKGNLIIPKFDEYGKYIALNYYKFRPEQKKALFEIIKKFELIHDDVMHIRAIEIGLPEVLRLPKAIRLLEKARIAGYLDDNYQPTTSKTFSALLANGIAERLEIRNKWKVFEEFWDRKNMYKDYFDAVNQKQSPENQKAVYKLFV